MFFINSLYSQMEDVFTSWLVFVFLMKPTLFLKANQPSVSLVLNLFSDQGSLDIVRRKFTVC